MTEQEPEQLNGTLEVDETFIGGRERGGGRGSGKGNCLSNKAIVIGVIQRGGKIRLQTIEHTDRKTLRRFIKLHCAPDTELIITDDLESLPGSCGP